MSPRFAFALLFSVCAFALGTAIPAFPEQKCGPNAEFSHCGSACVPDCANQEEPKLCTLQCVVGCFCKKGYMKNAQGECVLPQNCEVRTPHIPMQKPSALPTCPDNEEFKPCGSACAPTCANPQPSPFCTRQCVVGCFCKQGHLRNANGVCVPAEKCEAPKTSMFFAYPPEMTQCKDNEMFLSCGSSCAPTCANPHPGPICTTECVSGCFCKPGFLKNEQGVCMPAENCGVAPVDAVPIPAQMCQENEEFRQCKGCDGTCDKPNPICPRICIAGCACKQGHVRSGPNGRCMPKEQCPAPAVQSFVMLPPTKCNANEVFHTCGTACPATCANPNPSPVCTRNCVIGCFCKPGYLKNEKGACVAAANCVADTQVKTEAKCASDREMFVDDCGTQLDCMASCSSPLTYLIHGVPQIPKKCKEQKCAASCVCKFPYYRNSAGQCVERPNCDNIAAH